MKLKHIEPPFSPGRQPSQRIGVAQGTGPHHTSMSKGPMTIDMRPPGQVPGMKAGTDAVRAIDICCCVEYKTFIIELNAARRGDCWFAEYQILKDSRVVMPWQCPALAGSPSKREAIDVAALRATSEIDRGLVTAFCQDRGRTPT